MQNERSNVKMSSLIAMMRPNTAPLTQRQIQMWKRRITLSVWPREMEQAWADWAERFKRMGKNL